MEIHGETTIVMLVLVAAGAVLLAPVLGRLGVPALAELTMWLAAGCGVAAFGTAGCATWRAARRGSEERR